MGDGWNTVLGSIVLGWVSFVLRLLQIDSLGRGHILLRSHHRTWEITETQVRGSWGGGGARKTNLAPTRSLYHSDVFKLGSKADI